MKQFVLLISLLIFLLVFYDAVIIGTKNGLLLWYQTLIPTLLPFILVTNALSETNSYQLLATRYRLKNSNQIYEIMAIVLGNLCGYPIGGKIINDFVQNHYMSRQQADYLLPLASQASPMFLIGYIYTHFLKPELPMHIFLASIYFPIIIYYFFVTLVAPKCHYTTENISTKKLCVKDTFLHAVEIMVMIGIYVIIFSILLTLFLPHCQSIITKIFLSLLEITTGVKLLSSLDIADSLRLSLICFLSGFGGICSAYQINGVLEYRNPNLKKYLLNKIFLSAGTFCIIYIYCRIN